MDNGSYVRARLSQVLSGSAVRITDSEQVITLPAKGQRILIGVAFYSLSDLKLLDALIKKLAKHENPADQIEIFDVLSCKTMMDFERYIPGIGPVYQTPVVGIWDSGKLVLKASGSEGRKLLADQYALHLE